VQVLAPHEVLLDLGGPATVTGTLPVRVTVRNNTNRAVALAPAGVDLVPADGEPRGPLAGTALSAALAPGPGGERLRGQLLGAVRVAAHETVIGFLVYPAASYREARVTIEDVETGETEGFVTGVQ
jgi:hypothetical protein